jgi:hypothetical protein
MNGVPLALLPVLVLLLAEPVAAAAGVLVELDDEDEQPAAVRAARASAVRPTPADRPARLWLGERRVIFVSFSARYRGGPGRVDQVQFSGTSGSDIKNLMIYR